MADHRSTQLETLAIHAGQAPDPRTGGVMPAIELSTTFAQSSPGKHTGFEYARTNNPTRQTLEHCLAALENAEDAIAFSSGCAGTSAILHSLKPGSHVVAADDLYGGTVRILQQVFAPLGIETTYVDLSQPEKAEAAFRKETKLVWIESPTNPMLKIIDIAAMALLSHERGALLVVDNTFATPVLQRPLELGADIVIHSTTKYINGHSDAVGGIVMGKKSPTLERVRYLQNAMGAVPSPFDCFLVLRGVKTLPVRIERHCQNAARLASFLNTHAKIGRVIYPGLESHPQHVLAKKQMRGFGGMISLELKGGMAAARGTLERLKWFTCAESLGGVESLIEVPSLMTHSAISAEARASAGISDGLVRISVGLEAADDLIADLDQALA
jgi:cystathionine gamma-lyase